MKSIKTIALFLSVAVLLILLPACSPSNGDKVLFSVSVTNESKAPVAGLTFHYGVNEKIIGSFHCGYASNDRIKTGESFDCVFFKNDLPKEAYLSQFSFFLEVDLDGETTFLVPGNFSIPVREGGSYSFTLTGDEKAGFSLS